LEKEIWNCVYNETYIKVTVNHFYDKINCIIEKYTSEQNILSKNKRIKEWMTVN
jgi:hypothetical protein